MKSILDSLVSEPNPGATFALPSYDVPAWLRNRILRHVDLAPWNVYYSYPIEQLCGLFAGEIATSLGAQVSIHRGAEDALLALAMVLRPRRLIVPACSYPGYDRVAAAIGAETREYSASSPPEPSPSDWLVVTVPGNFFDNPIPQPSWASDAETCSLVVDATYAMPTSMQLHQIAAAATRAGGVTVFSLPKTMPFTAARLGGCIGRSVPPMAKHWCGAFEAALLHELGQPRAGRELSNQFDHQVVLHKELRQLVTEAGLTILGQESPLFVTASGSVHIPGLSAKWFDGDIVRIDVTPSNIAQILALTGGES